MDDKQFSCIAAVSCTSKATASKVLNHCCGVGSQVRARVLAQADRMQIGAEVKPVEVYAVFPELPGDPPGALRRNDGLLLCWQRSAGGQKICIPGVSFKSLFIKAWCIAG